MDELQQAREQIDRIDTEMAALFAARMAAVKRIAAYKQAHGLAVFDPAREQAVVEKNAAAYPDAETRELYASFLQRCIELSKEYQTRNRG